MNLLQVVFYSPVLISIIAIAVLLAALSLARRREDVKFVRFVVRVFGRGFGPAIASFLAIFILSIVIDAAQGPLAAMFFYAPRGFTVGVLISLGLWLAALRRASH